MPTDPKKAGAFKRREQSAVYIVKGPKGQEFEFEDPAKAQEFIDNYRKRKLPVDSLKEAGVDASDRPPIRWGAKRSMISGVPYSPGSALRTADSTAIALKQAELTAKKRDLQKPIDNLAKFHQLQNETSALGMIPEGKRTPAQQAAFESNTRALRAIRGTEQTDGDLEDLDDAGKIRKRLVETEKDPVTGLDVRVIKPGSPEYTANEEKANEKVMNVKAKKWMPVLSGRGYTSRNAILKAHGRNQQIFQEMTADAKAGRTTYDVNSADPDRRAKAINALRAAIAERMKSETGIEYEEYKQMLNDFSNQ